MIDMAKCWTCGRELLLNHSFCNLDCASRYRINRNEDRVRESKELERDSLNQYNYTMRLRW